MVCPYNKTSCPASRRAPTRSSSYLGGESGSHSGLDSDLLPVLSFLMGGVSPLSGLEPVLFRQRVHRLTVYTLFEDTSDRRGIEHRLVLGRRDVQEVRLGYRLGLGGGGRHGSRGRWDRCCRRGRGSGLSRCGRGAWVCGRLSGYGWRWRGGLRRRSSGGGGCGGRRGWRRGLDGGRRSGGWRLIVAAADRDCCYRDGCQVKGPGQVLALEHFLITSKVSRRILGTRVLLQCYWANERVCVPFSAIRASHLSSCRRSRASRGEVRPGRTTKDLGWCPLPRSRRGR